MRIIKANLLDEIDKAKHHILIPHVCNNKYVMGSGIAYQLAKRYPVVLQRYKTEKPKLGETQFVFPYTSTKLVVANMVAQTLYENDEVPLKYEYLVSCMRYVRQWMLVKSPKQIFYDILTMRFGSGLAGGNVNFIETLMKEMWVDYGINVTICEL